MFDERFDVLAGMLQVAGGEGREICVLAKDVLAGDVGGQLDEQAFFAEVNTQRIKGLGFVELVGGEIRFAERRGAQVDEDVVQWRIAMTAAMVREWGCDRVFRFGLRRCGCRGVF